MIRLRIEDNQIFLDFDLIFASSIPQLIQPFRDDDDHHIVDTIFHYSKPWM